MATNSPTSKSILLNNKIVFFLVLLTLLTFGIYHRVMTFEYINLDDGPYVQTNSTVQKGLSMEGLRYAFSTTEKTKAYWHPLTWLSHMLDYQLYGLDPGKHHLTNLMFHILNSLLLFWVLYTMTGGFFQSALIASLFALHPINVDSVAWVAERKNVLSTFFWMLAMLAYAFYATRPSIIRYLIVVVIFILGLMSKPMLVTLPCALLLLDVWPLRRIAFSSGMKWNGCFPQTTMVRVVTEKLPLLALSVATIIVSSYTLAIQDGFWTTTQISMIERIENALVAYIKYILKIIWPNDLAIYYPFPTAIPLWKSVGAACLLIIITILVVRRLRSSPWLAIGWFWYLGTLFPVIGLVQGGLFPEMADRWAYIPQIGLFTMIACPISSYVNTTDASGRLVFIGTALWLAALATMTWNQSGYWKNSRTLFNHSLTVTGDNFPVLRNLGQALFYEEDFDGAIQSYRRAIEKAPHIAEGHTLLADALKSAGKKELAVQHYRTAIKLDPDSLAPHVHLGILLKDDGHIKEALDLLRRAVAIEPDDVVALHNFGLCLAAAGDFQSAETAVLKALDLKPNDATALYNAGAFYGKHNKPELARDYFEKALSIDPKHAATHFNLGVIAVRQNQTSTAEEHLLTALSTNPRHIDALNNLGLLYSKTGRPNSAIEQFQKALKIDPNDILVRFNLANTLALADRLDEAMRQYAKIVENNPEHKESQNAFDETRRLVNAIEIEIRRVENLLYFDSENPNLLNELGDLHTNRGTFEKAAKYFHKLVSLYPEHLGALNKAAAAFSRAKNYEQARLLFEKVVSLAPNSPEGYYNVACMYSRLNQTGKGIKWLKLAVAKGYDKWPKIKIDEDLENLRNTAEFKTFIEG